MIVFFTENPSAMSRFRRGPMRLSVATTWPSSRPRSRAVP